MVLIACGIVVVARPAIAHGEQLFANSFKPVPGPRGAVSVIGDSVMLGSVVEGNGLGPSVSQMLTERGWGPVKSVAGVGLQAGLMVPSTNPGANMSRWVLDRRFEGWDPPTYMVVLGSNDVGNCNNEPDCAERDITLLVDAIGSDREIWWSMITGPTQLAADVWNGALRKVAATHPGLRLWDWPAAQAASAIQLRADRVHVVSNAEYVRKSVLMADDFTARLGESDPIGTGASPPTPHGGPTEYVPLQQHRLYDSRVAPAPAASIRLDLSHDVPAGTAAVSVNLTAIADAASGPGGFVSAYPCGSDAPLTSSLNFAPGEIRSDQAIVALGDDATLCASVSAPAQLVVDLQGAFVASGGLKLDALDPTRLVDTRTTGRADPVVVAIPGHAAGAVVNITAVGATAPGYAVAYPCDQAVPDTSNVNFTATTAVAGNAYVPVGASGTVCVHANRPVDVIVDLLGTFTSDGTLRFQPANAQRTLDTRSGVGGWHGQVGVRQSIVVAVAPPGAQAVTGNLTVVLPALDAFVTAYPSGRQLPQTSSANAAIGGVVANAVTVGSTGSLCVFASVATEVVFDTTGWWVE